MGLIGLMGPIGPIGLEQREGGYVHDLHQQSETGEASRRRRELGDGGAQSQLRRARGSLADGRPGRLSGRGPLGQPERAGVAAGVYRKADGTIVTYAGTASQAITASTTKYLYLTDAGALTVDTAWPTGGTNHVRLAIVVAGTSTITSITDARLCFISANTP